MGSLNMYLPPFAPDYSGACSLLYPMNAMLVIHDAQGCTSNYTGFDEPRWYDSRKNVFCSGLRKLDIALGEEEKYLQRIVRAARELKPELIALVGSPVPMVMGTDFTALAAEIEMRTGIITLGLETDGLGSYQDGIAMAGIRLLDRFLPEDRQARHHQVNLLGATPLDFSEGVVEAIVRHLELHGWVVSGIFGEKSSMAGLREMRHAAVSLALSSGGVEMGRWLEQYYAIPWLAAVPVGAGSAEEISEALHVLRDGERSSGFLEKNRRGAPEAQRALVLYEGVTGWSIARALERRYPAWEAVAIHPFSDRLRSRPGCVRQISREEEIEMLLREPWSAVVADPVLLDLLQEGHPAKQIPLGEFSVSSHLSKKAEWCYIGASFEQNIGRYLYEQKK